MPQPAKLAILAAMDALEAQTLVITAMQELNTAA
jgi:hypothetical protein